MSSQLAQRCIVGILLLFGATACDTPGTVTTPPQLGLNIIDVSNPYPQPGEMVTISWAYENPDLLALQGTRSVSLVVSGNLFQQQLGCLPIYEPNQACMDTDISSIEIEFTGPMTFFIESVDTNDNLHRRAIKLRQAGMDFRLTQLEFTNPGYPRFTGNTAGDIVFDNAFGIYYFPSEGNPDDGIIDDLAALNLPGFEADQQYFGLSWAAQFGINYGFRQGTRFPYIYEGFYFAEGLTPVNGGQADGLIFAGMIAINGTVETIKSANGIDVEIYTVMPEATIEPFIVQIDLRSVDAANGESAIYFSDLHVGNPAQGLFFSTYHGDLDATVPLGTMGNYEITVWNPDENNLSLVQSNGSIKGAAVGFEIVEPASGPSIIEPKVGLSVSWQNILLYPDDELELLQSTIDFK